MKRILNKESRAAIELMIANDLITKDVAEKYFPELKESKGDKGEKIRKWIYDIVNNLGEPSDEEAQEELEEMQPLALAWLEKQGEQKPTVIIPRFRVGDEIKTTNEAPLTITKITDSGYWSEDLFICSFENSTKWELVENPAEWSEEDEEKIDILNAMCDDGIKDCLSYSTQYRVLNEIKDWLKSLRHQKQWKPSERQMKALKEACDEHLEPDGLDPLYVLYEQLKELKGK